MNAEKQSLQPAARTIQELQTSGSLQLKDQRESAANQAGLTQAIQQMEDDEEMLQGKSLSIQREAMDEEDEMLQGKFGPVQKKQVPNTTGIPDDVKNNMEESFGTDFSGVRVHPDSSKAPDVGALAYTQGTDIHFAPGQFKPDTVAGRQLLGHELTHVVQQAEGRVQPTTEINGMPVNDDVSLENEADRLGMQAASR